MADKQIKTGGGSSTEGGDFTGRDRINQPIQQVTTTNIFTGDHILGVLAVVAIVAMLILGEALLIVLDATGVERHYVAGPAQGIARLRNFMAPDNSAYTLFVRNQNNTPTEYTLTVQAAGAVEDP